MGLKDTLKRGALLGATMLAVNVGAINDKPETDVRPKIEQKSVRDYSHLVDESKCVRLDDAKYLKGLVSLMARTPTGKKLLDNLDKRNISIYSRSPIKGEENTYGYYAGKRIVMYRHHFYESAPNSLYTLFHEAEHARHVNDLADKGVGIGSFQTLDDKATFQALEEASAEMVATQGCLEVNRLPQADLEKDVYLYAFQQGIKKGKLNDTYVFFAEEAIKEGKSVDEGCKEVFFDRLKDQNNNDSYLEDLIRQENLPKKTVNFDVNPNWSHIASLVTDGKIDKVPEIPHKLSTLGATMLTLKGKNKDFSSIDTDAMMKNGDAFKGAAIMLNILEQEINESEGNTIFDKKKGDFLSLEECQKLSSDVRKCRSVIVDEVSSNGEKDFSSVCNAYASVREKMSDVRIFAFPDLLDGIDRYMELFKGKKANFEPMTKDQVLDKDDSLLQNKTPVLISMVQKNR